MSTCAVPRVNVALRSLGCRNTTSFITAVASGRTEMVKNFVSTGWQRQPDVVRLVRRTVGDLNVTFAFADARASRTAFTVRD